MLGAVKAAHAGVGLRPDDEVEGLEANLHGCRMHGWQTPPINEGAENPAVTKTGNDGGYPVLVEGEEFGIGHLS